MKLVCATPVSTCLGFIGKQDKVCVRGVECETASHKHDKFVMPSGMDEVVFIQTGNGTAAWTHPHVTMKKFDGGWDRYRSLQRTVTQWQTYFEALNSSPGPPIQDVHKIGDATLANKPSYTPYKIRRVEAEEASEAEGEEGVFVDEDAAAEYVPIRPEDDSTIQWSAVANNMTCGSIRCR